MSEGYTIPLPWNRIAGSIVALFALLLLYLAPLNGTSRWIIFLIGTLIGSYQFTREVTGHIFTKKKVTTDVIMTLAIIGAAVLGELEEALTLVFLYSITETLESYTVKRTKVSITSLMKLVPKQILALVDGKELLVDVELLSVGDTVRIRVGDVIPTDGIIQTGSAAINEATVTGEAIPIFKTVGDGVLAGSHCSDGTFTYEVSKVVGESTVSKIINMVQEAQTKKIPTQLTIERFTKYYNPGIVIFSALVFIIPALITSEVRAWAIIAVTLLVASSPCALAISSPVTMYSAISSAASRGILVKGGVFLEELGRVEAVVFDKTGTLTSGQVVLSDIIPMDGMSRDEVLQLAASLEQHSQHPLARAVLRAHDSELLDVEDHRTQPGVGISGIIDGSEYFFGKWDGDSNLSSEGKSVSYLVRDNVPLATFGFRDEVRDHISVAIQELNAKDIPVFMLTGDNREAAHT
ncbi:MAG: heavy metal translocating P-type ATPase, partial [Candidatus Kariarchaeaceae archaeon]